MLLDLKLSDMGSQQKIDIGQRIGETRKTIERIVTEEVPIKLLIRATVELFNYGILSDSSLKELKQYVRHPAYRTHDN